MKKRKNPAAVALGKRGGKARAKALTATQRSESARSASQARWDKWIDNFRSATDNK